MSDEVIRPMRPGMLGADSPEALRVRQRRYRRNRIATWGTLGLTAVALMPLGSILWYVVRRGLPGLNLAFFTHTPAPVGEAGGGMANAIAGTLLIVGMACLMAVPAGLLAGVFLASGRFRRAAHWVRFAADVATGIPSIVIGIFVYSIVVVLMGGLSAVAGAVALAILMLPTVARSTEEMVRLVPGTMGDGALALGAPSWYATVSVIVPAAAKGIVTGTMLAVARAAGETAPLLFTAGVNEFWNVSPAEPTDTLPVRIFRYATSPYAEWHQQAWTGALVLILMVLSLNIIARAWAARR